VPAEYASDGATSDRVRSGGETRARCRGDGVDARAQDASFDATLVIVNYRTPELVLRCVESVRSAACAVTLGTVIVDNGSRDGSAERLRTALPDATIVAESDNRGFAAGVNAGLRATHSEIAIVANPDIELTTTLDPLVRRLREHPSTGVAAPVLEHVDGSLQVSGYRCFPGLFTLFVELCVPIGYALVRAPGLHPHAMSPGAIAAGERPAHVTGALLAIRRAAYRQAGPLDEGFFLYLEETEWQSRVAAAGWDIELVPQVRARHLVRGGGEESLAPSPHFVSSAVRYLGMRGVSPSLARLTLALALALSWCALRLIALLPSKRGHAALQARAYRVLLAQTLRGVNPDPRLTMMHA
jgi:N-acetylglucosaminyl-diphospho-decaprenol L-rhamnosyltransferase